MTTTDDDERPPGRYEPLRRAQEALTRAYEQARRCDDAPGSPQMRALLAADAHHQRLERERARAVSGRRPC